MGLIHKHLLLKLRLRKAPMYLDDPVFWEELLKHLIINVLKMAIVIEPRAVLVTDPDNFGVTASANLSTSHVALHVWSKEERPFIQMDVYSCRDFDSLDVTDYLTDVLGKGVVGVVQMRVLDRNNDSIYSDFIWGGE